MTKTTTTLLISLLVVACGKSSTKPHAKPPAEAAVARSSIRDVAVAQSHVCAVLSTGQVACWGELHGPLEPLTTKPEIIPGITGATAISDEDCVLRGDKPAMCWDNERTVSEVPAPRTRRRSSTPIGTPAFSSRTARSRCWDAREKKATAEAGSREAALDR